MDIGIIIEFGNNILLLMSTALIYGLFRDEQRFPHIVRKLIMGVAVSIVVFYVMNNGIVLQDGIVVDARAVVLTVSGMFFGLIPTIMGLITGIIFRVNYGGIGVYTGITWIILSSLFGLIWRYYRIKKSKDLKLRFNWIELYAFGLFIQIVMILLFFTLPEEIAFKTINAFAFPLLVVFPIGQLLVSLFIILLRNQYFDSIIISESEKQYKQLFTQNKTILMLIDIESGKISDVNDRAIEVYGYSKEEFQLMDVGHLNTISKDEVKKMIAEASKTNRISYQFQHMKKNGEIFDVEVHTGKISLNNKEFLYSSIYDISDRVQSQRMFKDADERLKLTLLSVGEGVIVTDEFERITVINEKALNLLHKKVSLERKRIFDEVRIYSNQSDETFESIYKNCIESKQMFKSDSTYSLLTADDDSNVFIDFTVSPISNEAGIVHGAIIVMRDVTIEKERQEEIRFMSKHDYLTGLYNRYNFETEVTRLNTKRQLPISFIVGDLNGLKLMNDAFGHLEGDKLIKEVASVFKKATRSEDIVARWGGDEFAILLPQTSEEGVNSVINRIHDQFSKSMYEYITPSVAIGCATKTKEDEDIQETLNIAEERMYSKKLVEGPKMRDELMHRLFTILNNRVPTNLIHVDNIIKLVNMYYDYHKLDDEDRKTMILTSKYHDIGKLSVDKSILKKRNSLNEHDQIRMKIHPETGSRIVATIQELQFLIKPILQHHERWDGKGYPQGLKETEICLEARIFMIFNDYEILTRMNSMSHEEAINEILKGTGKLYDPELVKKFIKIF